MRPECGPPVTVGAQAVKSAVKNCRESAVESTISEF